MDPYNMEELGGLAEALSGFRGGAIGCSRGLAVQGLKDDRLERLKLTVSPKENCIQQRFVFGTNSMQKRYSLFFAKTGERRGKEGGWVSEVDKI